MAIPCPICKKQVSGGFRTRPCVPSTMYRCKNCDFAFTAPLPPAEEFEVFYEEDYTDSEDWRMRNRLSVNEYWSHLRPFFPDKPFRFLEVGGAFGHFSAKVKSDTEASVVMLECGKSAANHARDELGLEVVQSFYENYHPVEKFDIIFSAHVIEHVRDVRAYSNIRPKCSIPEVPPSSLLPMVVLGNSAFSVHPGVGPARSIFIFSPRNRLIFLPGKPVLQIASAVPFVRRTGVTPVS